MRGGRAARGDVLDGRVRRGLHRALSWAAVVFLASGLGPGDARAKRAQAARHRAAAARTRPAADADAAAGIVLGVGDLAGPRARERAAALAPTGARAASTPCRLLAWAPGDAAPDPGPVDAAVEALQAAGFDDLAICLDLRGPRPAGHAPLLGVRSPAPPRDRHDAVAAWAASVVERYDGDGRDDMPDLAHPVRLFWLGAALAPGALEPFDDYLALLARVRRAARAASPDVRIAPAPLRARGVPPGAIGDRLEGLLASPGAFDLWSVDASGTPAELDAWLGWLARRAPGKPAAVFDARTAPLAEGGAPVRCDAQGPERARLGARLVESDRCVLAEAFRDLLAGAPRAVAWARAQAARDLAAKILVAASHGATRIEVGSATDDAWWTDPALEASAGLAAWSGLLERGTPHAYPAFFALRQVAGVLAGRPAVERIDVGSPDVWVYGLRGPAGPAWVAWYDAPLFAGPGQLAPATITRFPVGVPRVRVAPVVTELGTAETEPASAEPRNGVLWLELTPTPLVVLPAD